MDAFAGVLEDIPVAEFEVGIDSIKMIHETTPCMHVGDAGGHVLWGANEQNTAHGLP